MLSDSCKGVVLKVSNNSKKLSVSGNDKRRKIYLQRNPQSIRLNQWVSEN